MKLLRLFCYGFITICIPCHATQQTYNIEKSIICIESILNDGTAMIGTGFFIAPGIIVTAQHQVKNANTIIVYSNDRTQEKARLIIEDRGLAILGVTNKTTPYLLLENKFPEINTKVFTFGCQSNKQHFQPQLEISPQGTISDPKREDSGNRLIEANLSIKKGNSGGPLLIDDHHVVGIINGYDENENALSVSIPTAVLIQLMAQQQAIEFEPEITTLWKKAQESRDQSEQLNIYDEILRKVPWHTEAHYNQGIIYFAQHDFMRAKERFQVATQQRPTYYNAYIYLGIALSKLKDYAAARDSLIQAILIDTKNPIAYFQMVDIYQNGLADSLSARNALQIYINLETDKSKADIARRRLQKIEQSLSP